MRPDLPTGTVTFLFTDIEGSTNLLEQLGTSAFEDARAEHRRVLREAFVQHGGVEVDTQGDSFFVAFTRASDAVTAAADAQAALEPGQFAVRMGIHTGEPLVASEGYAGMDVHRAARIAAAGSGGQVLLSRTTRDLVDAEVVDLGDHRLKDLSEPERLFQLGRGEFPRLKSLHQTNLPVQSTPLVGRERELADVVSLLGDSARLLTLTGAGGTGKTRLALHAAAELGERFVDGVWFVALAPLSDSQLVVPTIARVLDVEGELGPSLRDKRMLLLLDNFEQVVDCAPEIGALLEQAPDVHVLVTSRERLRLSAEREYEVPVLGVEEATALFVERASRLDPSIEPTEDVRELVEALDGLPLAIELAAARIKVLSPADVRKQLRQSLDLLGEGDRDLPERHRTLRATIDWSYQLLDEVEQTAFTALGAFPGSFTADAAEDVAAISIGQLAGLVDKSLLRRGADGRFFMLATIREEARARLDASQDGPRLHATHAAHYLTFVEQSRDALDNQDTELLDRVELEHDDIRAALTWFTATGETDRELALAVAIGRFWYTHGHLAEGRKRLEHALAHGRDPILRARGLRQLVIITVTQGDTVAAAVAAAESIELHEALGDHLGLAKAYQDRANLALTTGDFGSARADFASADELFARVGNAAGLAVTASMLAYLALLEDDENALDLAEQAVNVVRAAEEPEMMPLLTLAFAYVHANNPEAAISTAREAGQIALTLGHKPALSYCVQAIAAAAAVRGDGEMAARLLAAADAARSTLSVSLDPFEERIDRDAREAARKSLSLTRFDAAWAEGAGLTLDEAVAVALGDSPGSPCARKLSA